MVSGDGPSFGHETPSEPAEEEPATVAPMVLPSMMAGDDELDNASSVPSRPTSQPSQASGGSGQRSRKGPTRLAPLDGSAFKKKDAATAAPGEGSKPTSARDLPLPPLPPATKKGAKLPPLEFEDGAAPRKATKPSKSAAVEEGQRPGQHREPLEELSTSELRTKLGLPAEKPEETLVPEPEPTALAHMKHQLFAMLGQCPKGHRLEETTPGGGNCDGCARDIASDESVWECQSCDWFLCRDCAPPPQAHAADMPALAQYDDRPKKVLPAVSSGALYRRLVDEAKCPIELAALAKLRVWSRVDPVYTEDELLDLVAWLEPKLRHPKIVRPSRIFWRSVRQSSARTRCVLFTCVGYGVFFVLLAFGLVMSFSLFVTKFATTEPSGLITVPALGLRESWHGKRPAGAGAAVHLRNFTSYAALSNEELRSMRDVVFEREGEFHFHLVASVSRLASGGVRVAGADGSVIQVESDSASFAGVWSAEKDLDLWDTGTTNLTASNWTSHCAFTVMTRHTDERDDIEPSNTTTTTTTTTNATATATITANATVIAATTTTTTSTTTATTTTTTSATAIANANDTTTTTGNATAIATANDTTTSTTTATTTTTTTTNATAIANANNTATSTGNATANDTTTANATATANATTTAIANDTTTTTANANTTANATTTTTTIT